MANLTDFDSYPIWGNYNVRVELNNWQKFQLNQVDSVEGVQCLLGMWLNHSYDPSEGSYCNATWDNVYCWPSTPAGTVMRKTCFEIFNSTHSFADKLIGHAERICLENATWKFGIKTNYNQCADSYDEFERKTEEKRIFTGLVQQMLFYGSIVSLFCLLIGLAIFYTFRGVLRRFWAFKCLWCDRVIIQSQLMLALVLRFTVIIVLTEPVVLQRSSSYRDVDMVCKGVVLLHLYASVCTVSWMFVQGLYLNHNLTTVSVGANNREHFALFYLTGWVLPVALVLIYLTAMLVNGHSNACWQGYSDMTEMWILLGPIIAALLLNAAFLINILRILIKKVRRSGQSDSSQIIAAAKATLILFPVLGVNNLLLLYNPGGDLEKYYVTINSFCGVSQGAFVSLVYCFINRDVHNAIGRACNRIKSRREGNLRRRAVSERQRTSPPIIMTGATTQSSQQEVMSETAL